MKAIHRATELGISISTFRYLDSRLSKEGIDYTDILEMSLDDMKKRINLDNLPKEMGYGPKRMQLIAYELGCDVPTPTERYFKRKTFRLFGIKIVISIYKSIKK